MGAGVGWQILSKKVEKIARSLLSGVRVQESSHRFTSP